MIREPFEQNTDRHEQMEVKILADTVLAGLELADTLEVQDIQPVMQRTILNIPADILPQNIATDLLPFAAHDTFDGNETNLQLTYESASASDRPSLELQLLANDGTIATIKNLGGPIISSEFSGSVLKSQNDTEYEFTCSSDDLSLLFENLVKPPEEIVISDQGVATLKYFRELVHDPQYPPTARFITDTLEIAGAEAIKDYTYMVTIDEVDFIIRTTVEEGRTSEITIIEVLNSVIEVLGEDLHHNYRAIGARIARTQLSQAVNFFHADVNGNEHSFEADAGDLYRLRERIQFIQQYVTK